MNSYFIPTELELEMVLKYKAIAKEDYALIRITSTMLKKSIIDASEAIRYIVENKRVIDYEELIQGQKIIGKAILFLANDIIETPVSYYRPKTKLGDPRFWVYGLTKHVKEGQLLYFTVLKRSLIVIPVTDSENQLSIYSKYITDNSGEQEILRLLKEKLEIIQKVKWIQSVSPYKDNPKDVGDSLEAFLGIRVNNLTTPDFMGQIEIKSKRFQANSLNSLFGKVPDWEISNYKSVLEIVKHFGYIKAEKGLMKRLYNNIYSKPNTQGLYMDPIDEKSQLWQKFDRNNVQEDVCAWWYSTIRESLETKHPTTLWVDAEVSKIDEKFHFKYMSFELSNRPIFSEFLRLIRKDIIIYDWKSRINPNGTSVRNHGPGFRITPKHKDLLFSSLLKIT